MKENKSLIHVAFFSHDVNLSGGGSISLLNLLDNLSGDQIKCFVFLPGGGGISRELDKRGIKYFVLPNKWWVTFNYDLDKGSFYKNLKAYISYYNLALQKAYLNLRALPSYIKLLIKYEIDVVYTNTSVIFMGALSALILRKPHIWHIREHGGRDFRFDFGNKLFYFLLRRAKAKVFVSEALQRQYPRFISQSSTFVVHNGIPVPPSSSIYPKDKNGFTFCMVGKLTKSKGQEVAINALSYLKKVRPDIRLILAGKGSNEYTAYLKEVAYKLGIENNVLFQGQVDDPYSIYYTSDVYLMCSTNESFGRVTVEAMLAKLPVIGYESEFTGTKEIIEEGVTGYLYRGEAKELFICMEHLINHPDLLSEMGEKAYKRAIDKFGVDVYAKKLESVIQYALS